MSFITYAQNFEDVLLWRALGHVTHGFYIDVGANDPEQHSVTKAFYDAGWHGINIEPMPSYLPVFAQQRPRDINLAVAAGAADGEITLFDTPDINGWASTDQAVAHAHRADGVAVVETRVPLRTLSSICAEHVRGPIHFLKIDVEGYEGEVLRGMDLRHWRPWILVIEATLPNSRVTNHDSWEALVTDHAYRFAYFDGLNRYYVADEHAELAACLAVQANVFDDFIPHQLDRAWRRADQLALDIGQLAADAERAGAHGTALELQLIEAARQVQLAMDATAQVQTALDQSVARQQATEANLHQNALWAQGVEQQLLAMQASRWWRLTKPLRALTRRGPDSLPRYLQRRARGAVRRGVRWLSERQWLRRGALTLLAHFPALQDRVLRTVSTLKHGSADAPNGAPDVPYALRELPQSARTVLADLRRTLHSSTTQ